MLRFSSSVGRRVPMCPTRASLGSPTSSNPKNLPLITAEKKRKEPPLCQFGENHVLEDWESDSNTEGGTTIEEPFTQDEETVTLSVSATSGLTHYDSEAPDTQADADKANANEADGQEPGTTEMSSDTNSNQLLTKEGSQDKNQEESCDAQKQNPKPVHGVRVPKYNLPQKRYIVEEAFSAPKRIRLTARKYKIANATLHHWKKLLENAGIDITKNVLIANESGDFVDGDGNVVESDNDNEGHSSGNTTTSTTGTADEEPKELILVSMWRDSNRRSVHLGRKPTIPDWASVHLKRYFESLRVDAQPVTVNDIVNEYMSVCPEETENVTYTALRQRIYRWAHNVNIVSRATTHQAQNGLHCHKKINDWIAFIRQQINIYNIPEQNVVNFDETNVNFSIDAKRTLDHRGTRTVNSLAAASSNRATVMIGVSMTGQKLTPFIVYKAKRAGRIHKRELKNKSEYGYPLFLEYSVQQNAWMDEVLMHDWITAVWEPYVITRRQRDDLFLLILDEFQAHKCPSVLRRLACLHTLVEFIPGGYTSKLQVMDVGLNRPFKRVYTEEHFAHLRNFVLTTAAGTKFNPSRQDVATWVDKAWSSISAETIIKTWKHIGIKLRNSDGDSAAYEDMLQTRIQLGREAAARG